MSSESFKKFLDHVRQDENLSTQLTALSQDGAVPVETLLEIGASQGYEFTVEDVSDELSDEQLAMVAGGLTETIALNFIKFTYSRSD